MGLDRRAKEMTDNDRFNAFAILLNDVANCALRKTLTRAFPNLREKLQKDVDFIRPKILAQKQWNKLYPPKGDVITCKDPNIEQFDIILSCHVLETLKGAEIPYNTLDVWNIRTIPLEYVHGIRAAMSPSEFDNKWKSLATAIINLAPELQEEVDLVLEKMRLSTEDRLFGESRRIRDELKESENVTQLVEGDKIETRDTMTEENKEKIMKEANEQLQKRTQDQIQISAGTPKAKKKQKQKKSRCTIS